METKRNDEGAAMVSHSTGSGKTAGVTIAALVHDFMLREDATEVELAALLAVDQTQIGRWRRGLTVPKPAAVEALADLLELDPAYLEGCRAESERVRVEVLAKRKKKGGADDLARVTAELRAANARIARLERKLR